MYNMLRAELGRIWYQSNHPYFKSTHSNLHLFQTYVKSEGLGHLFFQSWSDWPTKSQIFIKIRGFSTRIISKDFLSNFWRIFLDRNDIS